MARRISRAALASELAGLAELDTRALQARWTALTGRSPPPLSRALLLRAVAHRLQAKARGDLPSAVRRTLEEAARALAAGRPLPDQPAESLPPGTRLLRTWRGTTHTVEVLERGVLYQGAVHPSLSAVARRITGARWNGPAFFGLRAKGKGRAGPAAGKAGAEAMEAVHGA